MEQIFLVDDDAAVRKSLSRVLREEGFAVEEFDSAEAFLARAEPPAEGCIVLDVTMPGLDGLGLQARLREAGQDLPIVFLTGHGDIPMSVQAIKAGAVDFLTKPATSPGADRRGALRDRAVGLDPPGARRARPPAAAAR
jgi:FixJ family two-component response regulator